MRLLPSPLLGMIAAQVLLTGCAATPHAAPPPPPPCTPGTPELCEWQASQAHSEGRLEDARYGYRTACDAGWLHSCLALGRMLLSEDDLVGAEPPLRRAHDTGSPEGYLALAELYERRAGPADLPYARSLRQDALSVGHSVSEVAMSGRVGQRSGGMAIAVLVQPMAFQSRRLYVGAQVALGPAAELNGVLGYQVFPASWWMPYAQVVVGAASRTDAPVRPFNFGGRRA